MFRTRYVLRHLRRSRRTARLGLALMLPALVPAVLVLADVSGLVVSPNDFLAGGIATGTVELTEAPRAGVTITLTNSNPSTFDVPATVFVARATTANFPVTTKTNDVGCGTITARIGTGPTRSADVFVRENVPSSAPVRVVLPVSALGIPSSTVTGTVKLFLPIQPNASAAVRLSSSQPSVRVPSSITVAMQTTEIERQYGEGTFPITFTAEAASIRCAIITATSAGETGRALLKIGNLGG